MGWQGGNGFRGYRYPPHANGTPETAASELGGGGGLPPGIHATVPPPPMLDAERRLSTSGRGSNLLPVGFLHRNLP